MGVRLALSGSLYGSAPEAIRLHRLQRRRLRLLHVHSIGRVHFQRLEDVRRRTLRDGTLSAMCSPRHGPFAD